MLKAAIHCHSTYSDGEFTLAELRQIYMATGYDLVCMTDHAEYFDSERIKLYLEECERVSDDRFRVIAGLEFNCERRMHILGYGVTALTDSTNPEEVIEHIEGKGGISVIAHPGDSMFSWIEKFTTLPSGIETWNSKYDGPQAPRPRTFQLLNRLQQRKPDMNAFYGQDLHWKNQFRELHNVINIDTKMADSILGALRSGEYFGKVNKTELPSTGLLPVALAESYQRLNDNYLRKQKLFKRAKKLSGSLGKNLPAPVKARLRKIFT